MLLNIDCFIVELDFKYEIINEKTITTLCSYSDGKNHLISSVRCDRKKHNREFARKYALQKTIISLSKKLRTKIWKAYFEYLAKDKVEYLAIDGFGFQNVNGIITIDTRDKEIVLTLEQRNQLIKLLK